MGNCRRDRGVTWGGRGRGVPERAWTGVWSPRHLTQPEPRAQALSRTFLARDSRLFLGSQSCAPPTHPLPFPGPPQPNSDLRNRFEFNRVEKAFLPGDALLLISRRDGSLCKALSPEALCPRRKPRRQLTHVFPAEFSIGGPGRVVSPTDQLWALR